MNISAYTTCIVHVTLLIKNFSTFLQINYKEEMKCILLFIITFIILSKKFFCLYNTLKYLFNNQSKYQSYSNIFLSYIFDLIKEKNLKSYNNLSTKENLMGEILSTTIRLDIIVNILLLRFYSNKYITCYEK
jgi:hypothetical protein